jgi:hypothetical protein
MFDRVGNLAERVATNVSRRDFFGWAGKGALALAGLLAYGGIANASGCPKGYFACATGTYGYTCCPKGTKCCNCNGIATCLKGSCNGNIGCI